MQKNDNFAATMKIELSGHYGYRRIVKTMLPSVAMMILTSIYGIVDGFFISNFAGDTAFASMNLVYPVIAILSATGLMLGAGGSALVSFSLGEKDNGKANRTFTTIVKFSLIIGVVLAVAVILLMKPITIGLGATQEMLPDAVAYGRIIIASLPFFILQMAFQTFYMVAERPQIGTIMSIVCGSVHVGLDALFIIGFGWGLRGAAIATALSICVGGIYPLLKFTSRRMNDTHIALVRSRMDWGAVAKSCTNGASEYVGNIALNIVGICYNLQLMRLIGADGVSAYGIVMYIGFIFAAIFIGYNMGIAQIISYNYGAGNREELRSLQHKSLVLVLAGGALMVILSEILAPLFSHAFVGYKPELEALAIKATRIYMLSFLICGVNMFTSAWFTALGNGIVSAIGAFARTLVFELSAVFILPALLGVDGIWMSVDFAEVMALLLSIGLLVGFRKRYLG